MVETLPAGVLLAPAAIAFAICFLLASCVDTETRWVRAAFLGVVMVFVARYAWWRFFNTVLPAEGEFFNIVWVWFCFFVETLLLIDVSILFLMFLRPTNRTPEADAHEARLRATPTEEMPAVDVLIATYNEPLNVLEKTIIGALSLDYPNFRVYVLDDGRREWLRDYCLQKGAGYITRPDNLGAKAGNINHALTRLKNDFFAIFDADFVPQRNFLYRTMGFFEDRRIGIVQCPHTFYNNDPLQTNVGLQKDLPDDQRFFFESVLPARDGWDAAFCCGSNSVTRRKAMKLIGDRLPEGSITEDILLSMTLLRRGYVTRYLCEPLALGLAPESTEAFFVQRQRWARGAIQTLYSESGPLGSGYKFVHRLLFTPLSWISQSLAAFVNAIIPAVFLWTGASPLVDTLPSEIVFYTLPAVFALMGGLYLCSKEGYYPIAQQVLNTFQSFKLLPTVLSTLVKPHGHVFKVTPKGGSGARTFEAGVFYPCLIIIALTVMGLVVNADTNMRIVPDDVLLPVAAGWAVVNLIILLLTCLMCLQRPVHRTEERFPADEPAMLRAANGVAVPGRLTDISLTGTRIALPLLDGDPADFFAKDDRIGFALAEVGPMEGRVARVFPDSLGVAFENVDAERHDALIRKVFTSGSNPRAVHVSTLDATAAMLEQLFALHDPDTDELTPVEEPALAEPERKLEKLSLVIHPDGVFEPAPEAPREIA